MSSRLRLYFAIGMGVVTLALLIWLTVLFPPTLTDLVPGLLFCALILFAATFSVRLAEGSVSLLPMTAVAAFLVMGMVPAGWASFVSAALHGLIRWRWADQLEGRSSVGGVRLLAVTLVNATMYAGSVLVSGAVFGLLGGEIPLVHVSLVLVPALLITCVAYLVVNYIIAGAYIVAIRGQASFQAYLYSLRDSLFYEGAPLVFAPLMALVYVRLGVAQFFFFASILVVASLIARNLNSTNSQLERRVQELDSLQAVGQALSASLDVETVAAAIYDQTARLMPARNFYVAIYDPDVGEVSFPLAVEEGERVEWRSRRASGGLTEHILQTGKPLLISGEVKRAVQELGIEHIGQEAACWLGVPILAGQDPLGVIAVQSFSQPEAYDVSHQEVLLTIASQAAAAVQNARLYARTDEALGRRVQELDSVLRTAREGILLLDGDWHVLAANRTLAEFVGMAQLELIGQSVRDPPSGEGALLAKLMGYTVQEFQADCDSLTDGGDVTRQAIYALSGRHIERTLTPVRDPEAGVSGWLLFFRDITEEVEMARLRDDMMHMLVHDLRSPLTAVIGSLGMMKHVYDQQNRSQFDQLVGMAESGSQRMLRMVNELLDISKLESNQLPIVQEVVDAQTLLEETAARLASLAASAQITIEISVESGLPMLYIDPGLIGRTLNNLLDNAIKFTPDGGHIRLWAQSGAEGDARVGVTDSGPGIPPEAQGRLFEMFQQVEGIEGRRRGTGLGLPLCKLAVEAHGGQIWVESQVGHGSTFVMTLPIVK